MKRKIYNIYDLGGVLLSTKFAWNTARCEVRNIVKAGLKPGQTAELIKTNAEKVEGQFLRDTQEWATSDGRIMAYVIVRAQ